jgi:hypothetical protein
MDNLSTSSTILPTRTALKLYLVYFARRLDSESKMIYQSSQCCHVTTFHTMAMFAKELSSALRRRPSFLPCGADTVKALPSQVKQFHPTIPNGTDSMNWPFEPRNIQRFGWKNFPRSMDPPIPLLNLYRHLKRLSPVFKLTVSKLARRSTWETPRTNRSRYITTEQNGL